MFWFSAHHLYIPVWILVFFFVFYVEPCYQNPSSAKRMHLIGDLRTSQEAFSFPETHLTP